MIFKIFMNFADPTTTLPQVGHPRWSGGFLRAGNVRFGGVLNTLNNIFNISQLLVTGTKWSRPPGVTKIVEFLKINENHDFS